MVAQQSVCRSKTGPVDLQQGLAGRSDPGLRGAVGGPCDVELRPFAGRSEGTTDMKTVIRSALVAACVWGGLTGSALAQLSDKDVQDFLAVSRSLQQAEPVYKGTPFEKGLQAYEIRRWKDASGFFETAANRGNGEAQYYLGMMYLEGQGFDQNPDEALRWLRRAAEKKVPEAENLIGVMYADGESVPADDAEAVRWFRRAADRGFGPGQANLGSMYLDGAGVAKDEQEAARLYRLAAEQNVGFAQMGLSALYYSGTGVPKDTVQAVKWLLLAAEAGDDEAMEVLFDFDAIFEDGEISDAQYEQGAAEAEAWLAARKP